MTQQDYLTANPLCGTILQIVYVPKFVDSLTLYEPVVLASLRSQLDVKTIADFTDWVTTKCGSAQYQTALALGQHKNLGAISWPECKIVYKIHTWLSVTTWQHCCASAPCCLIMIMPGMIK